jgi:hypothetical protein
MNLFEFDDTSETWNRRLIEFERLFSYPLSREKRFSIDHSPNYSAFYRAMGNAKIVIAEHNEQVIAVVSMSIRKISLNDRHCSDFNCGYIGDLKIHPDFRSGRVLYRVAKFLQTTIQPELRFAYGVAMDGTSITPDAYTGRLGLPHFAPREKIHVLGFETFAAASKALRISAGEGYKIFIALHAPLPTIEQASFDIRSKSEPVWFAIDTRAVAMLEDTVKAKRLKLMDGTELRAAHISYFEFSDVDSATEILNACLSLAHEREYSSTFVAMSESQYFLMRDRLNNFKFEPSLATVYGTENILSGININTSEI